MRSKILVCLNLLTNNYLIFDIISKLFFYLGLKYDWFYLLLIKITQMSKIIAIMFGPTNINK